MPVTISSNIPSGNILEERIAGNSIELNIRGDIMNPNDFQWFNFELEGVIGESYHVTINNASHARFAEGWYAHDVAFQTSASYDGENWFFIPTVYDVDVGELTMTVHLDQARIQLAFFPPYAYEKHLQLLSFIHAETSWKVASLGKSAENRDITLVTIGEPSPLKKNIWMIAGQHPGEHQGPHYMDGLLRHLQTSFADYADIFDKAVFYCVPNINPDGTVHGNLRTNLKGKDLNRMWQRATIEESPEVFYVLEEMKRVGVDFFIDVHSDEVIPRGAFLDLGHNNSVTIDNALMQLEQAFLEQFMTETPLMQNELAYPIKARETSNLDLASAYIAEQYHCPAFTLEMPTNKWTVAQCHQLGIASLKVIGHMLPLLPQRVVELPMASDVPVPRGPGSFSFLAEGFRRITTRKGTAVAKNSSDVSVEVPVDSNPSLDTQTSALDSNQVVVDEANNQAPEHSSACCTLS